MNILPILTYKSIGLVQQLIVQYHIPVILTAGPIDTALQTFAHTNSINIIQVNSPEWFNNDLLTSIIITLNIEFIIVSGLPWKIPVNLINTPKYGTINIHPSLLPSLRGAWPLPHYILNNERYFGYTIHIMDETFDSGPILFQEKLLVEDNKTCEELESLIENSLNLKILDIVNAYIDGKLIPLEQNHDEATYASLQNLLGKNIISSSMDLNHVKRIFRAFNGNLGVYFRFENSLYKIHALIEESDKTYKNHLNSNTENFFNVQLKDGKIGLLYI